ncbi:lambda exonuclease family protein [Sphingobium sp. YR768]|uniref:lambda exonuclease family protein n=1 Tax=Sphingobium sp. YR768 TaxID=1884365 RepID=UPI0008CB72B5|nr:lambda exonuclease family protein [Sphingobium sp. YR768]SES07940.1 YqaJ-like recombinase domain-containing protein [Sphingobium sp. YR768]
MTDNPFALDYVEPKQDDIYDAFDRERVEVAKPKPETAKPSGAKSGSITHFFKLEQGTDEWLQARCGLLTASEMKLIITPTLKVSNNDKERAHLYELLAQRITKYVEPKYISDDMLRGQEDEIYARAEYEEKFAPVTECGFITNDEWGFTLGYSPDGLVGDDGAIEAKSRRAKYQVQTIIENMGVAQCETIPADYLIQHQTGMAVSKRQWIDFISYSGGLPTAFIRVHPDHQIQDAIINAAGEFERKLAEKLAIYEATVARYSLTPTERREHQELVI